ncbi:MAG: nickel pincer cofactor biosynthesis protein LarB [Bacteroidales bacterium]
MRTGYPEIVYCAGKTPEQVRAIFMAMEGHDNNIIGTRAGKEMFDQVSPFLPSAAYYETARIISIEKKKITPPGTHIAIITAGTSDIPVAEEAAATAELLGNNVVRIYDAGVAGIHRLVDKLPEIRACRVAVVIAGMEGALASVVGGLVNMPVIAGTDQCWLRGLPSKVFLAARHDDESCAAGVTVVNIDNGFGAGLNEAGSTG